MWSDGEAVARSRNDDAMLRRAHATIADRPILVRYGPPLAAAGLSTEAPETGAASAAPRRSPPDHPAAPTTAITTSRRGSLARAPSRLGALLSSPSGQALATWGVSRVLLLVYTLIAAFLTLGHRPGGVTAQSALQLWQRSDTNWYLHIAQSGYSWTGAIAFFPLYPLVIAAGEHLFGAASGLLVALAISNLACLAAFLGVARLAASELHDVRASRYAVLALAVTPLAFFLSAAYTESLFFAFAVWGLWAMRRAHWYRAAICVFLAVLCRSTGVILIAPLVYEYVRQNGPQLERIVRTGAAQVASVLAAGPAALGIFSAYCLEHSGDPLAWLHIETTFWRHDTAPVWQGVHDVALHLLSYPIFSKEQAREVFVDLLPLVVVFTLTIVLARHQPLAFTLYLVGLLYLTIASPIVVDAAQHYAIFDSAGRYMLPAVPIYLALGGWAGRFPRPFAALGIAAVGLQAVLAVYFLAGGPII